MRFCTVFVFRKRANRELDVYNYSVRGALAEHTRDLINNQHTVNFHTLDCECLYIDAHCFALRNIFRTSVCHATAETDQPTVQWPEHDIRDHKM